MATKNSDSVEAVCLLKSSLGECGELVTLTKEQAKVAAENGLVDLHKDAIAHAKK